MSTLLGCLPFSAGIGAGFFIGMGVDPLVGHLNSYSLSPFQKKVAFFALEAFIAISMTALHFSIPCLGLCFFATRFLQGGLLLPMIILSGSVQKMMKPGSEEEFQLTTLKVVLFASPLAFYLGVPLLATFGLVSFGMHLLAR